MKFMNWGVLLFVLGLGLAALVVSSLWPQLNPGGELLAWQKLEELWRTWEGVQDLRASVEVRREGEPTLRCSMLFLAEAAVRLELQEPPELAGEVYALRPVAEGWLLVHFRPALGLGLEARFSGEELASLYPWRPQSLKVRWLDENTFLLSGLGGEFEELEVHTAGDFRLPSRIFLRKKDGTAMEIRLENVEVNSGLELRELLILDPLPTRWIQIPTPLVPGA